jgi:hypothetical protein
VPTAPPDLTETTVRYLFATTWLPSTDKDHTVAVPGGETTALDTAGSLLHIALWNLRRRGLMEFEQIREVSDEPVRILGGRSFSRYELRDSTVRMPGLEGALLRAAGEVRSEDEHGLRRLIRQLDLGERSPWSSVCGHCFAEAHAAGLVEVKGRLFKRVVFTDLPAVESLRGHHDTLRAARGDYMTAEPELSNAVASDCLRAVLDAYSPNLGD